MRVLAAIAVECVGLAPLAPPVLAAPSSHCRGSASAPGRSRLGSRGDGAKRSRGPRDWSESAFVRSVAFARFIRGFATAAHALILVVLASPSTALAREPRIDEVQAAAVRTAHADPGRAAAAANRARAAGLLPALRVRVARDFDRDQSLDLEPGTADQLGLDASDRLILEVRAEWDLSRLAYDPDELRALESAARLARDRREIIEVVTRLYFERLRLLGRPSTRLDAERSEAERDEREAERDEREAERDEHEAERDERSRLGEVTAVLDALTGGYLGRQLRRGPR